MNATRGCSVPDCDRPAEIKSKRLCRKHYARAWAAARRPPRPTPLERLQARTKPSVDVSFNGSPCMLWQGKTEMGYGRMKIDGRSYRVHRLMYEYAVGPIPDGMDIDHLCHNADTSCPGGYGCPHRACLNPEHLEPATRRENHSRGRVNGNKGATHCIHGHEFTPENTIRHAGGTKRMCRECKRARDRRVA